MIRRPPRSTPLYSSAASDVYKRQLQPPLLRPPLRLRPLSQLLPPSRPLSAPPPPQSATRRAGRPDRTVFLSRLLVTRCSSGFACDQAEIAGERVPRRQRRASKSGLSRSQRRWRQKTVQNSSQVFESKLNPTHLENRNFLSSTRHRATRDPGLPTLG